MFLLKSISLAFLLFTTSCGTKSDEGTSLAAASSSNNTVYIYISDLRGISKSYNRFNHRSNSFFKLSGRSWQPVMRSTLGYQVCIGDRSQFRSIKSVIDYCSNKFPDSNLSLVTWSNGNDHALSHFGTHQDHGRKINSFINLKGNTSPSGLRGIFGLPELRRVRSHNVKLAIQGCSKANGILDCAYNTSFEKGKFAGAIKKLFGLPEQKIHYVDMKANSHFDGLTDATWRKIRQKVENLSPQSSSAPKRPWWQPAPSSRGEKKSCKCRRSAHWPYYAYVSPGCEEKACQGQRYERCTTKEGCVAGGYSKSKGM